MVRPQGIAGDFETVVRDELRRLRQAYIHLLASVGAPRRAEDVANAVGIDLDLAHRVRVVADAIDPLSVCNAYLCNVGVRQVVEHLAGVPGTESATADLTERTRAFEETVHAFADDRAQFDGMVASLCVENRGALLLESRRSAFRANALVVGSLRRGTLRVDAVGPSKLDGLYAVASLMCGTGHQRIRRGAPVHLASHNATLGSQRSGRPWQPLDDEAFAAFGAPILPQFSSAGLGSRIVQRSAEEQTLVLLDDQELGTPGAIDIATGFSYPATDLLLGSFTSTARILTPSRRIVHEFLVHRDLPFGLTEVRVNGVSGTTDWLDFDGPGTIPIETALEEIDPEARGVTIGSWSHHDDALDLMVERMGWRRRDMRRFRLDLRYPLLGSSVLIRTWGTDAP